VCRKAISCSDTEREVLNSALEKYQPGQSEPILVGGNNVLKPALRLMTDYRVVLEEIKEADLVTTYTRWLEAVQVRGTENQEVYLTSRSRRSMRRRTYKLHSSRWDDQNIGG
jgi:hypothetical protein